MEQRRAALRVPQVRRPWALGAARRLPAASPAHALPHAALHRAAPLPAGKGLIGQAFPFPILLLDNTTAEDARRRAAYNAEQARLHVQGRSSGARSVAHTLLLSTHFCCTAALVLLAQSYKLDECTSRLFVSAPGCSLAGPSGLLCGRPSASKPLPSLRASPALQQLDGALHHARMHLTMEASGNSSACIAARSCLPVGGNSVIAALPPLPPSAGDDSGGAGGGARVADDGMPAVWLLAQFDTAALFHEAAAGADAPVSGLIALLAAAEVLGSADASAAAGRRGQRYRRRLMFGAVAGEPWGLMGSKRLLWEAAGGGNASAAAAPALGLSPGRVAGVSRGAAAQWLGCKAEEEMLRCGSNTSSSAWWGGSAF